MNKDVLFFFVEKDGRVRQIVNGVTTSLTTKKPLPQAPIGSQEISIGWERSMELWGNIRNFSLPLGFVMDGGKMLRNDMYKFTVDRELWLLILRYVSEIDATHYKDYYKYLYKGQLDFSTFDDKQGDRVVEMSIMEGGIHKLLKSQAAVEFAIPFDDDAVLIRMDGIALQRKANYRLVDGFEIDNTNYGDFWWAPLSFISEEGSGAGIAFASQTIENINGLSFADKLLSSNWMAQAAPNLSNPIDLHIIGKISYQCTEQDVTNGLKMRFLRSGQNTGNQNDYQLFFDVAIVQGQIYTHDIDITIPLQPGERLYLEGFLGSTGADTKISFLADSKLVAEYERTADPTNIKAFTPYVFFKKLCAKMGIDSTLCESDILKICTILITCGDAIRGLDDSEIKTTWNDFFKAYSTYLMGGAGIVNGILRFEYFTFFFVMDSVRAATELGEAKDMNPKPATDLLFSSVKVGHAEQEVDDVNGKFDFNGYQIYTSPEKIVTRQLDLQSPYKAGPYEIEITRMNLEGKTTTGNSNDNDVFVIDGKAQNTVMPTTVSFVAPNILLTDLSTILIEGQKIQIVGSASNDGIYNIENAVYPIVGGVITLVENTIITESLVGVTINILTGPVYLLDRSAVVTAGVPSPATIFNVRLSPDRILSTWFPWIKSFLFNYDGEQLIFESANRNKDLVADGLVQKRDIDIDAMGTPIARPFYIEFGTQVPNELIDSLETDPNRCFATNWERTRWTGFLWNAGIAPNSRAEQTYKLLMTAENDPKKLIL